MPTVPVFAQSDEAAETGDSVVVVAGNDEVTTVEETAPAEEPEVEAPAEEPKVEAPAEEPKVEAPAEEPEVEAPAEEPKVEAPAEEPKAEAPAEEPKVEAPAEEPEANTTPIAIVAESVAEAVEAVAEEKNITWEWTSEISKVTVTVTAPKTSIEKGTEAVIRDLTDDELEQYKEYFKEAGVSEEDMVTFDIAFYDVDGNEITDPIE